MTKTIQLLMTMNEIGQIKRIGTTTIYTNKSFEDLQYNINLLLGHADAVITGNLSGNVYIIE